jgi:PAS domain S-box-containing protein
MSMPTAAELSLVDAMPHIMWVSRPDGTVIYFNARWTAYTGVNLEESVARGTESFVHPDDLAAIVPQFTRSYGTGESIDVRYRLRRLDGTYRWHHGRVVPFRRTGERVTAWLGTATDIHEEYELSEQRRYLLEASAILGTSLEVERTLADVARLLVPYVADWCAIDLLQPDGSLHRPAVAHVDPDKVRIAWDLWRRMPPKPEDTTGVYNVIRTGQPEWTREITDEMLVSALPDPELLASYRALGLRSGMTVPLRARGRVIGTVSLVSSETQRLFEERDLAFATELAGRIAIAVDNARLYQESGRARAAAEAMAQEVFEQSRAVEAMLVLLRQERDEAVARLKGA